MRGLGRSIVIGIAAALGVIGQAQAADLYGGLKGGYPTMMASPATWYIRLDGGYGFHSAPTMVEHGIYDLTGTNYEDTWTLGGGIGRYLGANLRGDITLDHRFESDVSGSNTSAGAVFPGKHTFGLSSTVVLANLYYDLGTRSGITPYVGAGLGAAYHEVAAGTTANGGTVGSSTNWPVAGALMAGLAIELRQSLSFDAGYRFLYLGETEAGNITSGIGQVSNGPTVEEIHAHEFRFGLRYDIN